MQTKMIEKKQQVGRNIFSKDFHFLLVLYNWEVIFLSNNKWVENNMKTFIQLQYHHGEKITAKKWNTFTTIYWKTSIPWLRLNNQHIYSLLLHKIEYLWKFCILAKHPFFMVRVKNQHTLLTNIWLKAKTNTCHIHILGTFFSAGTLLYSK